MNKSQFRAKLAARMSLTQGMANEIIDNCLDIIANTMRDGEPIVFQGFGLLTPWEQAGREGRNPRTGEACPIRPRTSVKFKPGKYLLQRLNKR